MKHVLIIDSVCLRTSVFCFVLHVLLLIPVSLLTISMILIKQNSLRALINTGSSYLLFIVFFYLQNLYMSLFIPMYMYNMLVNI